MVLLIEANSSAVISSVPYLPNNTTSLPTSTFPSRLVKSIMNIFMHILPATLTLYPFTNTSALFPYILQYPSK